MLYIFHGEDSSSSLRKIDELKFSGVPPLQVSGKTVTLEQIEGVIFSDQLFSIQKIIIIDSASKLKKDVLQYLSSQEKMLSKDTSVQVIFWEEKTIKPSILKMFPNAIITKFEFPNFYFSLLDSLYPTNFKNVHNFLLKTQNVFDDELLFYSIIKRLRLLLAIKSSNNTSLEEIKKMSPWQSSKLSKQASLWKLNTLLDLLQNFYQLEKHMKSSGLSLKMIDHIDILLYVSLN